MSHRGEASMKHDKKVCDFCPIITPPDYIGIIFKLAHILPREFLITVKSFVRPHIDYSDIIYDQPNNDSFCNIAE